MGVYMVGTERVSRCIYGGNRESEWVAVSLVKSLGQAVDTNELE